MDRGDVGSRVRGICMNNVACNISPRAFLYIIIMENFKKITENLEKNAFERANLYARGFDRISNGISFRNFRILILLYIEIFFQIFLLIYTLYRISFLLCSVTRSVRNRVPSNTVYFFREYLIPS